MRLPLFRPLKWCDFPFVQSVGPDLLEAGGAEPAPLVEDFDALASNTLLTSAVDPRIRGFYEGAPCTMVLEHFVWERWALPLAWAFVPIASALGNLCVPAHVDSPQVMAGAVRTVELGDGGASKAWFRSATGTGQRYYAAAMRCWVDRAGEATYVSMAFPMPLRRSMVARARWVRTSLMVLMRVHNTMGCDAPSAGLVLTTSNDTLAGTYSIASVGSRFVALPGPPTEETLSYVVGPDSLACTHEGTLAGRRTFSARFALRPRP